MMRNKFRLMTVTMVCFVALSVCAVEKAHSFIAREYTLQEVLDACTNIAFGRMESVDKKRQRAIVRLEENIKGKSGFSQIKINAAVGQRVKQSTPEMLMQKFGVGLPIIVFYQREGNSLNGLCYVSGTWFQIFGDNKPDKSKVWWRFTHLEIHMHRTFSGSTEELQTVLRAALSGDKWPTAREGDAKVLVLTGNGVKPVRGETGTGTANVEFLALKKFNRVDKWKVAYQDTKNKNLPALDDAHILWIGVDELGLDGYHLDKAMEDRIKNFVKRGGIAIVSSQDSDPGKPCGNGWIPEPIKAVDIQPSQGFKPTKQAGDIFKNPRAVKPETVHLDDTWTEWSDKYKILATTNDGNSIVLATLKYGKGMYLVTALQNETEEYVKANSPLMENIIHFSVKEAAKTLLTEPVDRVKTLVLTGNGTRPIQNGVTATAEFQTLKKFGKVGKWTVAYQGTRDRGLPNLNDTDILWIGVDEIGMDGYHLSKTAEDRIKSFVQSGGVVIVSSQDSDVGKSYKNNWLPEPIQGVEESARSDFAPTRQAGEIFKTPRQIKSGVVNFDDTWTGWSKNYRILATTNNGKNIALAMLEYGKGMYLMTALQNESSENVRANGPLMENIIYFSVKWLKSRSG